MIRSVFTWFEKWVDSFPAELPEMPPRAFWPFMAHYTRPFYPIIAIVGIFGIIIAVLEVVLFAFLGNLVDWLTAQDKTAFWQLHQTTLIAMAAAVLIVLPVLKFIYEAAVHQGLLGNFAMRTRWQTHRYVLRQSLQFFQDDFAGRVATKVMQTSLAIRDTVLRLVEVFLYVSVYFLVALVMFAASDLRLTAPMILWLIGYLATLYYFVPRLQRVSMQQADHRSIVTGRIVDSYTNIATVKMFAHTRDEDQYVRTGMEDFLDNVYLQMRLSSLLTVILHSLNAFLMFSIAGLTIWLWSIDAVTAGAMAFAVGLVYRLQGMSQWILSEVWALFENLGVVQDGLDTIARNRSVTDRADAGQLKVTRGEIRYSQIRFNYGKRQEADDERIINDLNLVIRPGEKIGLVGRSGAGKSTLVNLLLRFYDLEAGRIDIDDQNIAEITQDSLRKAIGMVTQDTSLLHRSVIDNIRYSRPDAPLEDVIAAAKLASAHDFILELEDGKGRNGYDAHVGERGVKLSGGQRQRIAIARVLLKNAPILVLDEATSALDSEVEAAIQDSLQSLMEGKTVIAIAHRLSTIAAMDRLIIMDKGRIIEQGSHSELLEKGGLYKELWQRQSGGFLTTYELPQDTANSPAAAE